MSAPVQAVLERAAQILERDGWDPSTPGMLGSRGCMVGALCSAMDELDTDIPAVMAEVRARIGGDSLTAWGQTPGRTFAEVLAVLRIPGHCECEMDGDQRATCRACRAREEAE